MKECCGTCICHKHITNTNEWTCNNPQSDNYGLETEYDDCCDKYDEK